MVCVKGESMYMETRGQLWGISSLRLLWVPGTELGCKNCLGKRSAGWAILLTLNLNSSWMNVNMYSSSHKCVAHWIFKNEIDRHQGQGELRLSVAFFPSLPLPKVSAMLTCTDGHAFVTDTNRISHTACKAVLCGFFPFGRRSLTVACKYGLLSLLWSKSRNECCPFLHSFVIGHLLL